MQNNLVEGSVAKKLIFFSIPFLVSNIVQSFYNVADMLIVGNFSGAAAMSGVNIGGQVTFILTNLVIGLCTGGTVLIAQYFGANEMEDVRKTTATVFTMLIIAAVVLTSLMLVFIDPVLALIQTPPESLADAKSYLSVTVCGLIFIFGYNALAGIMRGMGDSKRPFIFVLIACITNVLLDLLFIIVFDMGAFGAAVATVISQGLSMLLCVLYMIKNNFIFDFKPKSFRIYGEKLKLIFMIGLPSAVQNTVTSISFTFVTAMVNSFGVYASAAVGAVGKFNGFAIMPAIAMSSSISTMAAQNIGAERWDRAIKACKIGLMIAAGISLVVFVLVQLFPSQIIGLFADDPIMIEAGISYLRMFSFDYLFIPFLFCLNGLYVGAGHTVFSLINSMMSSILLRVPISYLFGFVLDWGLRGIGLGGPVASLGSLIVALMFLLSGKWKVNVVKKRRAQLQASAADAD